MDFLVDINPEMELPKYDLVLCKLNEEPLMTIQNIDNLSYKGEFANIDELSFQVPLYRTESNGDLVENERYHSLKGDMLILLNNTKYFYIHYAKESINKDGSIYKEIQAYSREYELSQKRIVDYSGISRKLYYDHENEDVPNPEDENPLGPQDEDGLETGILNYVEKICSWKVGYIKSSLLDKFRELNFPNSNLLEVFQELQQTYGCLFQFNTFDKIIDVYEADQLGVNQGLIISDRNFLQELNKDIKSDAIKTRLYLYGMDNVSIQKLNITGQPYIENYDFYKNTDYMSQELIDALNDYDAFLVTKEDLFNDYLDDINVKNASIGVKNDELIELQSQLKVIQSNLDIAITSDQPSNSLKTDEIEKLGEISSKLEEVISLQNEIEIIETNIRDIATSTSLKNHFTDAQARELDSFIREDIFQDSNYTEDNIDELLEEGKKILNKISQPAIQFSCSVVDFLSSVECQHSWSKFVLGDKISLYHKDLKFDYEVRFIGYTHDISGNSLKMRFSNTNSMDDANLYLRDLLADLKTTSTNVDFNKYKWDKGDTANSKISQYIDSNLDLEKQKIMSANSQRPLIDERGIWLVKEEENIIHPEQIRLANNAIVMTQDGWNNVEVAISPEKGINANLIKGKLGEFAEVRADQIIVGANGETIPDEALGGSLVKQNENYNSVVINSESGLVATRDDDRVRTSINATSGIKVETKVGSEAYKDVFSVDVDGNLELKGNVTLSEGFINWNNVNKFDIPDFPTLPDYIKSTYIDATTIQSPTIAAGMITGAIFRTDIINTKRMELSNAGLKSFNSSNYLDGVSILPSDNFGKISFNSGFEPYVSNKFYDRGSKVTYGLRGYVNTSRSGTTGVIPTNTSYWSLIIGYGEPLTMLETEIGEIIDETSWLEPRTVSGIKSYGKHIELYAASVGRDLGGGGDIMFISPDGDVSVETGRTFTVYAEDEVYLESSYDLELYCDDTMTLKSRNGVIKLYGERVFFNGSSVHSDIKLKENIVHISDEVLSVIDKVDFLSFNFKKTPERKNVGVIAQWVEKTFEDEGLDAFDYDLVQISYNKETKEETKFVNYTELLILKVASLENKIKKIEERLFENEN